MSPLDGINSDPTTTPMLDPSTWTIEDVFVTPKGAKYARLTGSDGNPIKWVLPCKVVAPFGPSCFDKDPDATRLNLDLRADNDALIASIKKIEEWVVDYLAQHAERLFKRPMTIDQVRVGYSSCLKTPREERFSPLLKTKVNLGGKDALVCWSPEGVQIPMLQVDEWRHHSLDVLCHVSHLWMMGASFGLVLKTTDLIVHPPAEQDESRSNPFLLPR